MGIKKHSLGTYARLLAQPLVYLHPGTQFLTRVSAGLFDENAYQFGLQFGRVQALLQCILGEHNMVIDTRLIYGHRHE